MPPECRKGKDFHHGQDFYNPDTLGSSDSAMQGDVSYAVKAQRDSLPGSSASYETNDRTKDDGTGGAKATMADKETVAKGAADEDLLASVNNEHLLTYSTLRDIKHRFHDRDESGHVACNFSVTTHLRLQFEAVRRAYFEREAAVRAFALAQKDSILSKMHPKKVVVTTKLLLQSNNSLTILILLLQNQRMTSTHLWRGSTVPRINLCGRCRFPRSGQHREVSPGTSFAKSKDGRFHLCKVIAGVELKMFLHFARAYFEYMANAFYNDLPTVMCKILGIYTLNYDREKDSKRMSQHVVVMENPFYHRNVTKVFDLKGSSRNRYVEVNGPKLTPFDDLLLMRRAAQSYKGKDSSSYVPPGTNNLSEEQWSSVLKFYWTTISLSSQAGDLFPLKHRAKVFSIRLWKMMPSF